MEGGKRADREFSEKLCAWRAAKYSVCIACMKICSLKILSSEIIKFEKKKKEKKLKMRMYASLKAKPA